MVDCFSAVVLMMDCLFSSAVVLMVDCLFPTAVELMVDCLFQCNGTDGRLFVFSFSQTDGGLCVVVLFFFFLNTVEYMVDCFSVVILMVECLFSVQCHLWWIVCLL